MERDKLARREGDEIRLPGASGDTTAQMHLAVASLVVDLVRMGAEEARARADDARKWEEVHRRIALMDRESQARLRDMEHQLRLIETRTERLRLVLRTATEIDQSRLEVLGAALSKAIEQLTSDPE
jgi:hypothetical protein